MTRTEDPRDNCSYRLMKAVGRADGPVAEAQAMRDELIDRMTWCEANYHDLFHIEEVIKAITALLMSRRPTPAEVDQIHAILQDILRIADPIRRPLIEAQNSAGIRSILETRAYAAKTAAAAQ
jgi:hypothetical protein